MSSLEHFDVTPARPDPLPDVPLEELPGALRLQDLSTRLIHEGDVQALYQHILDTAMALTHADLASLQVFHSESGEFRLIAWRGETASPASLLDCVRPESGGPYAIAMRTGTRVVVPDIDDSRFVGSTPEIDSFRAAGIRSMQATPLVSRTGQSLGVISTHWREEMPHDPSLRLFDVLARQTADLIERAQSEVRLRETARQKDALYTLADRLHRTRSLDDVYDAALKAILVSLQCDRASILLFDEAGAMRFVASGGLSDSYRDAVEGHSAWRASDPNPAPIHIDDVRTADLSEPLRESILAEGIGALAFIPLVSDGQLIGKFMAYFDEPHRFSRDEMDLCLMIARQVAFAIERKRAEDQLRGSERRFREMLEALPAAIYMTDAEGYVVHFNHAAVEFAGRTPEPGVDRWCICWKVYDANGTPLDHEDSPMVRAYQGAPSNGAELIAERPDGARRWVVPYPTLMRDNNGRIVGGVNMLVDITARKEAEKALRDADRRKDEFLAMLSHELRNPLAAITIAAQVLRQQACSDSAQQEARAIIDRQTARLTRLVDDLLEVSRITSGRIRLQTQRVALRDIVERAVESAQPTFSMHRHTLIVSQPPQPTWLHADAARLEQVLINLLYNAAKYTDDGGRIQLLVDTDATHAVIRVIDNGIGIEADLLPRIFDLFTQSPRALDRAQGGLGIGLSLVQRLVAMHDGEVSASSIVGQGSEFVVRLPLMRGPEVASPAKEVESRAAASPLRVLVVDDNIDAARGLAMLLEAQNYVVSVAYDGQAALDAVREHRPQVIFLDIGLPVIDGYEVARRLRKEYPREEISLVALTGYGKSSDRELASQAGFDLHMVKPADIATVLRHLEHVADARTRSTQAS